MALTPTAAPPSFEEDPEIEVMPIIPEDDVLDVDDSESIMEEDEFPEGDIRVIADALVTNDGEAIADVMAGIRDALDTLGKVVYKYLKTTQPSK